MRLKCVSKRWRSIIGSKGFIKTHLQKSPKPTTLPILHRTFQKISGKVIAQTSLHLLMDSPGEAMAGYVRTHKDPLFVCCVTRYIDPKVVGCCNGILCLLKGDSFHLWNPATRVRVKLPEAWFWVNERLGFGYDETSDAYKVLAVVGDAYDTMRPLAKVYSSETNSWRTVAQDWDFSRDGEIKTGKFVCKKMHWLTPHRIESFDLKNEVFGAIELPFSPEADHVVWMGEVGGCLSLVYNCYNQVTRFVCLWMMKEYGVKESWVKQVVVLDGYEYVRRHMVSDKEEGVDVEVYGSCGDDAISSMEKLHNEPVWEGDGMHFYVESLVSPVFESNV